jgi:arsenate reductase
MLYSTIKDTISKLDINLVSKERQAILQPLINFIQTKTTKNEAIRLNFICTHNSRRSHLSQVWAQVMAFHFNIKNVASYSGGTEATALFPKVAETLTGLGFNIEKLSEESNPIYSIQFSDNELPLIGFSKKHDANFNPKNEFCAILTCSSADVGCPFIPGAEKRIPITFEDPKAFDNTKLQTEKYLERCLDIATELKYVFSKVE